MDYEKILRAKLDWWKTWTSITYGATITSTVAYWANVENSLPRFAFLSMAICSAIAVCIFIIGHESRYRKLIKELQK